VSTDLCFVGIDVSKDALDVSPGIDAPVERFENNPAGHRRLASRLRRLSPAKIVLEATGGYEARALGALSKAGLPVVRVNPRPVRDFAKGLNILAKTDRIDARILARYAKLADPPRRPPPDERTEELGALTERRRQLVQIRVAETNRLEQQLSKAVAASIRASVRFLEKAIGTIEDRMKDLTDACEPLRRRVELLDSVPGVGRNPALVLASELPELGSLSRQQVAALAGLAPYNNDSGRHKGKRTIRGGRADARSALYMAALVAVRRNPALTEDYQRLIAAGKPPKVALIACARKLLTILNAIIRDDRPWTPPNSKKPLQET
jgi:transposase